MHRKPGLKTEFFWGQKYGVPGRPDPLSVAEDPVQSLVGALKERNLSTSVIGIDMQDISVALMKDIRGGLPDAKFVDAHNVLLALRMIKTPEEIERLRGAVKGVERGHYAVREALREGMSAFRRREGIPVTDDVWQSLTDLATTLGVDWG